MSLDEVGQSLTRLLYEPFRRFVELLDGSDDSWDFRDPLLSDDTDLSP